MRAKGQVGQIICTCGRVGELRTRGNGNFLPFLMCKHCGMKQGKDGLRAEWLANEKPNNSLGAYGEFPSTSNKTSNTKVLKQSATSNKLQSEWKPEGDLIPEQLQVENAAKPDDMGETSSSGLGMSGKIALGILSFAALAFGVTKLS